MKALLLSLFCLFPSISWAQNSIGCGTAGSSLNGSTGTSINITCPTGCTNGSVWGTHIYSDDSSVCSAAIHAGAISASGGQTTVVIAAGQPSYSGSYANGISSDDWSMGWSRSFTFSGSASAAPAAPSGGGLCSTGSPVNVLWAGVWFPAVVVSGPNGSGQCYISYDGYSSDWNEWVGPDRMRAR